ncbi:MAG: hypothetical protein Q7S22_07285 [Candidatus Micrarchaeota archaeon]|nr:hypothetical protein [Candidatus Micrarchaeota archaeon]
MTIRELLPDEGTKSLMTHDNFIKIVLGTSPEKAWIEIKKVFGERAYAETLFMAKKCLEDTSSDTILIRMRAMQVLALSPQDKRTLDVLGKYLDSNLPYTGMVLRTMITTRNPAYTELYLGRMNSKNISNENISISLGGLVDIANQSPERKKYIIKKVSVMLEETGKPKTYDESILQGYRTGLLIDLGVQNVDRKFPFWVASTETIKDAKIRKLQ